ncbi:hypothetical protein NIES4101_42830 [Calothrix sp. NIES-4101]|nr:hypothetical protein NIES4101_42830 [Calothrix sp. NIES-4101]
MSYLLYLLNCKLSKILTIDFWLLKTHIKNFKSKIKTKAKQMNIVDIWGLEAGTMPAPEIMMT